MRFKLNGNAALDLDEASALLDLSAKGAGQMADGLARQIQELEALLQLADRLEPAEEFAPVSPIRSAQNNLREVLAEWLKKSAAAEEERAMLRFHQRGLS